MAAFPVPRFDQFYRYPELTRLLQDYAEAAPGLVQLQSLGRSHEGREIWLLVLTNQATGDHADKPALDPSGLQSLLERLAGQAKRPPQLDVIQAGVGKEVRLIRVADVIYFEADARYTRVVHHSDGADGEALIRTPLKELLAQLDERDFLQVHRSVIVARRHVASAVRIDEGQMHLTLRGRRETLPVSRPFQGLFKGQ